MSGITKAVLMAGAALSCRMGPMTEIERRHGRYMRAPDHPGSGDAEFDQFTAAGDVEVGSTGDGIESNVPEKPEKPAAKAAAAKPAAAAKEGAAKPAAAAAEKAKGAAKEGDKPGAGEGDEDEPGEGDEDEDEDEEQSKPKPKKASERIRELNARLRQSERLRLADSERLSNLEKSLLQGRGDGGNGASRETPAPDPSDQKKYPLGHLDDRYIEDKLEWLADKKAGDRADAVLQRQQESEQGQAAEQARTALLEKVDALSAKGSEIYDDFQEAVVEAGMRGSWKLDQPTFEAAHDADHGPQILYELSQDKKEAARVASLSPYQQLRFVIDRDAEISAKAKPRTKPGAGEPPSTKTKGANSSHRINPATDNLVDFERAWLADEKG
jgi:hypothetical protein